MTPISLYKLGNYSMDWVKDFYEQTAIWWGPESDDPASDGARANAIERLCGPGAKRVLELGAGAGRTAAAVSARGHSVVAVELSPLRVRQARELLSQPRKGSLEILEADFYTVELEGRFDVVSYWDGFGIGSDADQRRLLRRISDCWLAPGGSVLVDVASTSWAARHAGIEERLKPLKDVPGSVEMIRRFHFDPVHCRWIDEWQPADEPEKALEQTVRCYTPADFQLLLEGTGLSLKCIEIDDQEVDFESNAMITSSPLMEAYSYLAQLVSPDRRA